MIDEHKEPSSTTGGPGKEPNTPQDKSATEMASTQIEEPETQPADVEPTGVQESPDGREIVVPLALYKTITVFSTLAAIVTFSWGFYY